MPIKVGIVTTYLSGRNPRGVARIAHAFIERAVADDRFECLSLDHPHVVGDRLVLRGEPLDRFRERVRAADAHDCRGHQATADIHPGARPLAFVRHTGRAAGVQGAALGRRLRATAAHSREGWRRWAKVRRDFYAEHGRGAVWARGSLSANARAIVGYLLTAAVACIIDLDVPVAPPAALEPPVVGELVDLDDIDVVVASFPFEPIWELPLELSRHPFVVGWFHDAIPLRLDADQRPDEREFFDIFMRVVPLMAIKSSVILCISRSAMNDLHDYFPAGRAKSRLVYIGHDFRLSDDVEIDAVVTRCGLDRSRPIVLLVGAIERRKNLDNICRAIELLGRHGHQPAPQFVFCGDDGQRHRFATSLDGAAREATVVELGYVDDATRNALLSASTVFLYPSLWEGFGIPILEAYAAGCLVVTSNLSSMPEIGGDAALYCDPGDVESIAAQVARALAMPDEERTARIAQGREIAGRFSWDRMYAEVCRVILERRGPGTE